MAWTNGVLNEGIYKQNRIYFEVRIKETSTDPLYLINPITLCVYRSICVIPMWVGKLSLHNRYPDKLIEALFQKRRSRLESLGKLSSPSNIILSHFNKSIEGGYIMKNWSLFNSSLKALLTSLYICSLPYEVQIFFLPLTTPWLFSTL